MGLSSTHPVSALQSGPFGLSAAALIRQSGPTRPRSLWRGFLLRLGSAIRHRNQRLGSAFRQWLAADAEPRSW